MSVTRPVSVEEAYLRIIEDTIARSSNLQSPAVLDQLKERWIERLRERLAAPHQPPALSPTTPQNQRSSAPRSAAGVTSSTDCPAAPPLRPPPTAGTHPASPCKTESATQPPVADKDQTQGADEEEDDDWDTAKWETADQIDPSEDAAKAEAAAAAGGRPHLPGPQQAHDSQAASLHPAAPRLELPQQAGDVNAQTDKRLYEDEEDFDDATLSDLEDAEPECSDLVVSQFESIARPHARKPSQKGLWRIKLRHGILQIEGREILFNSLHGDLTF